MVDSGREVLVTGATGFIGSAFTRLALAGGYRIVALVKDPRDSRLPRHPAVRAALWDPEITDALPLDVSPNASCVHLAAFTPPDLRDAAYAEKCLRVNALATEMLAEAVGRHGVSRFIYPSGGSLYINQGRPVTENDPVYPSLHAPYYTTSKLAGEIFAQAVAARNDMAVCTLRISSVYGPGMRRTAVVPRFLDSARRGETLRVTEPKRTADFVYVDDVARSIIAAIDRQADGIINVGSGVATTMRGLAEEIQRIVPCEFEIARSSHRGFVGFPPLDMTYAARVLGLQPTTLAQGLQAMLAEPPPQPS